MKVRGELKQLTDDVGLECFHCDKELPPTAKARYFLIDRKLEVVCPKCGNLTIFAAVEQRKAC